ncbi:hypothetical protein C490_13955 [Natronobacterium gregoryi SP2]|nr:hypothetical protein C490_13955 [Natronobacterium gregoryi SP2]
MSASTLHIAGCLDRVSLGPPELALGRIRVKNFSTQDVEIDLSVEKAGKEVYQEEHSLEGWDASDERPTIGTAHIVEDWMAETAEYEIHVDVLDTEFESTRTTESVRENVEEFGPDNVPDGTCYEYNVRMNSTNWGEELDGVNILHDVLESEDPLSIAPSCEIPGE